MVRVTLWTHLLLLVLILRQSDAVSDHSGEMQQEICPLETDTTNKTEQYEQPLGEYKEQQTHSSEAAFRSMELAEDEFQSKIQQTEGIVSSLKKQLEANEEVLKSNNEKQKQLHATIDGLIKALENPDLTEEELFGLREIATPMLHGTFWLLLLVLILILRQSASLSDHRIKLLDGTLRVEKRIVQRITELEGQNYEQLKLAEDKFQSKLQESKGVISNLKKQLEEKKEELKCNCETQKQMQATIGGLTKTEEINNRTIQELNEKRKQLKATIDGLTKREETNNRTIQGLNEKQKQLKATIDGLTKTEETKSRTIQELNEKQKQLKATTDGLTRTLQPDICRYLLEAVKSGDVNTVKILFKSASDTCTTDDQHRSTPLTLAAMKGHVDVVRVLLEGSANVESTDAYGSTALHCAAWNGNMDVCRLLLDGGAKVDPLNEWKNTPLHSAAYKGKLSVVELLVERGADVRLKNGNGQTASDRARSEGKQDVADWLDSVSRR